MKNLIKITLCLLVASLSLTSCGDDEPMVETSMLVNFNEFGYVFVFPNRSDYDPTTFEITDTRLGDSYSMAQMNTNNGEVINSIATVIVPKKEYGEWDVSINNKPWLQECKPGTYYLIAYVFWGWSWDKPLSSWYSRVVTIKANNGNAQKFEFKMSNGYGYLGSI